MRWYDIMRHSMLVWTLLNLHFPISIGIVERLVEIRKPCNNPTHSNCFNGRKKMFCMNNTIVVPHKGLFFNVNLGYPSSYHNISILRHSCSYKNWGTHFKYNDENSQCLIGDLQCMGAEMFIFHWIGVNESPSNVLCNVINAFNKDACILQGSCGVEHWRFEEKVCKLTKWLDATKSK